MHRVCLRCRRLPFQPASPARAVRRRTPVPPSTPSIARATQSPLGGAAPSPYAGPATSFVGLSSARPSAPNTPGRLLLPSPRGHSPATPAPEPALRRCATCGCQLAAYLQAYRNCAPCRAVRRQERDRANGVRRVLRAFRSHPDGPMPALDVGRMDVQCTECGALPWEREVPAMRDGGYESCCKRGGATSDIVPVPDLDGMTPFDESADVDDAPGPASQYLKRLFSTNTDEAKLFRAHTRQINSSLSFTSFNAVPDDRHSASTRRLTYSICGSTATLMGPLRAGTVIVFLLIYRFQQQLLFRQPADIFIALPDRSKSCG
ncbi:hypothetical protein N7461_004207 [Penicillium sp. DV-2018c]|nr:hypothetical protein N7461_004207 [Penicillium sp. DV-2018c]